MTSWRTQSECKNTWKQIFHTPTSSRHLPAPLSSPSSNDALLGSTTCLVLLSLPASSDQNVSCKDTTPFNTEKLISSIKDWFTVWIIHPAFQIFPLSVETLMGLQAKRLKWIINAILKKILSYIWCSNTTWNSVYAITVKIQLEVIFVYFFVLFLARYPHTAVV